MRIVCLLFCVMLASCSAKQTPSMPELVPVSVSDVQEEICENSFVKGDWQFVHSINFEMNNGHGATLVGITVLQEKKLKTVLMGVEGFVLFEAEQEISGKVLVRRAMPPFDKTGFAEGLMGDVQTLLMEPEFAGRLIAKNSEDELLCRYIAGNGQVIDVVTATQGWNRITRYNKEGMLQQIITTRNYKEVAGESIAERITLIASGVQGYTLQLQLLSAEKI